MAPETKQHRAAVQQYAKSQGCKAMCSPIRNYGGRLFGIYFADKNGIKLFSEDVKSMAEAWESAFKKLPR